MKSVIADALQERIVNTFSTIDVPLRQAELAAEFGTSHIPVREALALLAEKGLVLALPNRGAVIPPMSAAQCRELALMRCALETLAIEQAMTSLQPEHLRRAELAHQRGRHAATMTGRASANWAFHDALYAAAPMPRLRSDIERLWTHTERYLRFAWREAGYEARSDVEHAEILVACRRGDVARAVALTREHILEASRTIEAFIGRMQAAPVKAV
jgi:DNA-binding GntR family transcriptional regulator